MAEVPPKWHGEDYAERRVEAIRNRPPVYKQNLVINDDIDWLIEEIERLRKQLMDATTAERERIADMADRLAATVPVREGRMPFSTVIRHQPPEQP